MHIDRNISDIMTTQVIFVAPEQTMDVVEDIFNSNNIHHLPVLDQEGRVVGILSKEDYLLLCDHFSLFRPEKGREANKRFLKSLRVEEIMSKQVATLQPEDRILLAVGMFKENLFRAIPIVDEEKHLVGLVTTYDLLNYAFQVPLNLNVGKNK
jgi:CBS-domain-containing membrane protein